MSKSKSNSKNQVEPSALISAALALDEHFSVLIQLSERIDYVDLNSNSDFDQCERLMKQFAETGEAIGSATAIFANALNETRVLAETAAQKVSAKAELLKVRKEERNEKMGLLNDLNSKVNLLNQSLLDLKRPAGEILTDADREDVRVRLQDTANQITGLIAEAEQLRTLGRDSNIKSLERNAEAMRKSLVTVNQQISNLLVKPGSDPKVSTLH